MVPFGSARRSCGRRTPSVSSAPAAVPIWRRAAGARCGTAVPPPASAWWPRREQAGTRRGHEHYRTELFANAVPHSDRNSCPGCGRPETRQRTGAGRGRFVPPTRTGVHRAEREIPGRTGMVNRDGGDRRKSVTPANGKPRRPGGATSRACRAPSGY